MGVFWNGGTKPGVPLDFRVESTPSFSATGMPESFPVKAGKGSLIGSRGGGKGAPLELWWDPQCSSQAEMVMPGNFLSCSKVVKDPLRFRREGRYSLGMPQQKTASSRLEGRTSWFFSTYGRSLSSYDGDFRDPLVCPQERPVSKRVARGPSCFLSSQCRVLGTCLELQPELEVSSAVLLCILGFLWSLHRRVRTLLKWRHARPFFYQA